MTIYNTAYSFACEVIHQTDSPTPSQIRKALQERLNRLSDEELMEAVEAFDTFEEEE
jgi:hypothetical protein